MTEPNIELLNIDCLHYMKQCEDKQFDLAIVDPPYGLGKRIHSGGSSSSFIKGQAKKIEKWDDAIPSKEYFKELLRVSKNQIVWGGNYFAEHLGNFRCFVYWDKTIHGNSYSDGELAWTSFDRPSRYFRQNIATITSEGRIHPTQKSIKIYEFIIDEFCNEGQKILDTHLGSGSIAIACYNRKFDLVGCEIDKEYFNNANKRLEVHKQQLTLF
ncbi:MAG: site-specific DNA-methyltransferase [Bacteroidetes bacterium]|nr:site-specific DNA-methyltransferase [Bacteroidota bacterium]